MDEADKRRILDWLRDQNKIQRDIFETDAGKRNVIERDVSGGLAALLRYLCCGGPFDPEIMIKLAEALDPLGGSTLYIGKRLRRGRGSPSKAATVKGAVRHAYEVRIQPSRDEASKRRIEKNRPVPPVGMKRKKAKKRNPGSKRYEPFDVLSASKARQAIDTKGYLIPRISETTA